MKDRMLWAYVATFTQTTSTGNPTIVVTANERTVLIIGALGPNNYTGALAFDVELLDEDDKTLSSFVFESIDNSLLAWPQLDQSIEVGEDGHHWNYVIPMGKGDHVDIVGTSLLATNTLTISLRAYIKTTKPTVTATTTAGTIPVSVAMDKVI